MKQYYYSQNGREAGPYPESTIINILRSGTTDIWVRVDGDERWYIGTDLPGDVFTFVHRLGAPSHSPVAVGRTTPKTVDVREIEYKARTIVVVSWVFIGLGGLGLFSTVLTGALSGNAGIFGASVLLGAVACAIGCLPFAIYLMLGKSIQLLLKKD